MASRIGSDLRRARTHREVELADVEAATRIRVRFLEAIEREEWDTLPGGVYTRGFIRTYASYLGMDGERLAQDYREQVEGVQASSGPARELAPVAASHATGSPGGRHSLSRLRWLVVPAVLLVAVAVIVLLPDNGDSGEGVEAPTPPPQSGVATERPVEAPQKLPRGVELQLSANAEVWVCLLDDEGKPLVKGVVLEAGAREGPFRSGSFTVSLGNGEVSMLIDGKQADIPASSSPLGYSVGPGGELTELEEAERPTCI